MHWTKLRSSSENFLQIKFLHWGKFGSQKVYWGVLTAYEFKFLKACLGTSSAFLRMHIRMFRLVNKPVVPCFFKYENLQYTNIWNVLFLLNVCCLYLILNTVFCTLSYTMRLLLSFEALNVHVKAIFIVSEPVTTAQASFTSECKRAMCFHQISISKVFILNHFRV